MMLIGTVDRLKQRGLCAFIRADSQEFFAHKSELGFVVLAVLISAAIITVAPVALKFFTRQAS